MFRVFTYGQPLKININSLFKLFLLAMLLNLSACGGGGGSSNDNDDPLPPPPPAEPPTVTTANNLNIDIRSATYSEGKLTVNYFVSNDEGYGFVASPGNTNNVRFTLAKLIPASDGNANAWQSYINREEVADTDDFPNSMPVMQATNESANVDNPITNDNNGNYSYTYATDLNTVTDPVTGESILWEADLTHRVAIEFRSTDNNPATNAAYDFVPSGNALTETRDIVATESCNQCHTNLALHGGNRTDTPYCVTCHNPTSTDSQSGNTVDFTVMVHKIHRGANLPGILAAGSGAKYSIFGFRNTEHVYAENTDGTSVTGTHFSQDIRTCTNCHVSEEDKAANPSITALATIDGDNWKNNATIEACGSCHDDVAFNDAMLVANPYMNTHDALYPATNQDCSTCHGPGQLFEVAAFHTNAIKENKLAASEIMFNPVAVAYATSPATGLDITFNLMMGDDPVNDLSDIEPYLWSEHPYLIANWDNGDGYMAAYDPTAPFASITLFNDNHVVIDDNNCENINNTGDWLCNWNTSGLNNNEPIDSGTVQVTFSDAAICVSSKTNKLAMCQIEDPNDPMAMIVNPEVERVPTPVNKSFYNMATLAQTDSYESKIGADLASCNTCHGDLTIHNAPTNTHASKDFEQCTSCHNATRMAFYTGRPADLKFQVHKLHSGEAMFGMELASDGGHGVEGYPAPIGNCLQCHTSDQIDLPLQQNPRASYTASSGGPFSPVPPVFTSATTVACSSCHLSVGPGYISAEGKLAASYTDHVGNVNTSLSPQDQNIVNHMIIAGGAVFGASNAADATGTESCATCHAIGSSVGVEKAHMLSNYQE